MRVKVHQDIEGVKAGETVDVPESRAKWLLAEGYASTSAKQDPGHGPSSVEAELDPRRAENADQPNKGLADQVAEDGLGNRANEDADPVGLPSLDRPAPVEATNAKGDPEKAAKGKATLEERAVKATEDDDVQAAEEQVS